MSAVRSPGREALARFCRNPAAMAGTLIFAAILVLTVAGPWLYPVDPFEIVRAPLTPPGDEFAQGVPLGTDYLGRDVLAGIVHGGRATLAVGGAAAFLTVLIGVGVGALAGFHGGWVDAALMRLTEFFQVLPPLLLAMVLVTLFSPTLGTIAVAIGVVSWPGVARLARGEFLRLKDLEFVEAARAAGAYSGYLILRVILPNALPPLIVAATLAVGVAILFEAGLSFLGLGDPNIMSWGLMIGANRNYIRDGWWAVTFPGLAIFFTVLSVSLMGDGLNDAFNPRFRGR